MRSVALALLIVAVACGESGDEGEEPVTCEQPSSGLSQDCQDCLSENCCHDATLYSACWSENCEDACELDTCTTLCGDECCGVGYQCFSAATAVPGTTVQMCLQSCGSSFECQAAGECCALTVEGLGVCLASEGSACLCASDNECISSGAPSCAPYLEEPAPDAYTCKPTDGAPYHGCAANLPCGTGYCCLNTLAQHFCASECTGDDDCDPNMQCYLDVLGDCSGCIPR
jgi:hypothetical protein